MGFYISIKNDHLHFNICIICSRALEFPYYNILPPVREATFSQFFTLHHLQIDYAQKLIQLSKKVIIARSMIRNIVWMIKNFPSVLILQFSSCSGDVGAQFLQKLFLASCFGWLAVVILESHNSYLH